MDRDQNGYIDADDLVDCMVDLAENQQQRRLWFAFALTSMLTTLLTIVVIVGLSVFIQERFKDTQVCSGRREGVKGAREKGRHCETFRRRGKSGDTLDLQFESLVSLHAIQLNPAPSIQVTNDVMQVKGSNQPIQVASMDFTLHQGE